MDKDRYIHAGLAEMGAAEFFRVLSSVCMSVSQQCGISTDAEKAARNSWLNASRFSMRTGTMMQEAGLNSPFVMREEEGL